MADAIDTYLEALDNQKDRWQEAVVLPYASAYRLAYHAFQDTLDRQSQREKLIGELVVLGLTIASGSLLAMVAGQSVMKTVGVDAALSIVCRRNMTQAFKVMAAAEGSAAARFALGAAWDGTSRILRKQANEAGAELVAAPAAKQLARPGNVENELERYVLRLKLFARDEMVALRDDPNVSPQNKVARVEQASRAPFFAMPPTLDIGRMARDIELGFYLNIILNSDRLETVHYRPSMKTDALVRSVHGRSPITQSVGSGLYPAEQRFTGTTSLGGFTAEEVRFSDMGHALKKKVNKLSGEPVFDTYMFGRLSESIGFEHIQLAERLLKQVAERNTRRLVNFWT